jgi:ketosteroid isomerase-like protein
MGYPSHRRSALPFLALLVAFGPATAVFAQEIPLEHCDALPLIEVKVAGHARSFLVDTAATSMLNRESFGEGSSRDIRVTSWTGTLATSAKEVTIADLEVGRTKVVKIALPAIDLSAIGKACGRKIDGILGADLLQKIGATVDLKRQMLHVTTADEVREAELASEMQRDTARCTKAFNESDEITFGDCLDPKIVLFTTKEELYGREKVASYFRECYFHQAYPARLEIRESAFHAIGEAVWYEYEFTIDMARGQLSGRGMAMCRKTDGRWRMASMHHSDVQFEPKAASAGNR